MISLISAATKKLSLPSLLIFFQFSWLEDRWHHVLNFFTQARDMILALGLPGMFIIAIFDSSLLSIPEINDVLVVTACVNNKYAVFYYPLVAASGSVIGCLILFHLTRKGGRAILHKRFSPKHVVWVEDLYRRYGALALIIPSLCPPPTPFKIFVATAGALQYPRNRFIMAVLFGRFTRYTVEGILAVMYGQAVLNYLKEEPATVAALIFGAIVTGFIVFKLVSRWLAKRQPQGQVAT